MEKIIEFTAEDAKALAPTVSDMELRVLAETYADALVRRRNCWVEAMMSRYRQMERIGLALSHMAYSGNPRRFDRTIVEVFTDTSRREVKVGLACCAPDDAFDLHYGTAIAFARAMGEKVPIDLF